MNPRLAGVVATAVMSGSMRLAQTAGLLRRPPPGIITERAVRKASRGRAHAHALSTTAAHFAFGAAMAESYEATLPVLRLMPPAHRDARGRVATIIFAHVVYGATLDGLLAHRAENPHARTRTSQHAASAQP